jgi:NADPH:quinone reductase
MKAAWLEEFGASEVLVAADAPDPVPGPGQASIEVAFANITFVETMFRQSRLCNIRRLYLRSTGNGHDGGSGVRLPDRLASP